MKGSTGTLTLDLSGLEFGQTNELKLSAEILQRRQVDLLVYRQRGEHLKEWGTDHKASGRAVGAKEAEGKNDSRQRRRQAYSLGHRQASALEIK